MNRLLDSTPAAITTVMAFIVIIWYGAAVYLNSDVLIDKYERQKTEWNFQLLVSDSWSMGRPVLPAPHQIMEDMNKSLFERKITSKRSLVYHGGVTISSTLVGFVMGGVLGILLAIGIVHVPTLNKSVLPWIIASQTIPILAVAPMIIVVLGAIGLTGLLPKAFISAYLCFFPIVGLDENLQRNTVTKILEIALAGFHSISVCQLQGLHCHQPCRCNCGRAASRCKSRTGRQASNRILLWADSTDLERLDSCLCYCRDTCFPYEFHGENSSKKNGALT